jgi:hypothetical protein
MAASRSAAVKLPLSRRLIRTRPTFLGIVLVHAADVHRRQRQLQDNHRPRALMPAPDAPEAVACEKAPEAQHAAYFALGSGQPRCEHGDDHCRPLQEIQPIHGDLAEGFVRAI